MVAAPKGEAVAALAVRSARKCRRSARRGVKGKLAKTAPGPNYGQMPAF